MPKFVSPNLAPNHPFTIQDATPERVQRRIWKRHYQRERAHGAPRRKVDKGAAMARITYLHDRLGWTYVAIAAAAGISASTLRSLVSDKIREINRETEQKILAVRLRDLEPATELTGYSNSRVPETGTQRRIQALLAIGWPHPVLKEKSGIWTQKIISDRQGLVSKPTHDAIKALYDELSMTPGPSNVCRGRARSLGYAPPLAWDDDSIDDPRAQPALTDRAGQMRRPHALDPTHPLAANS